MTGAPDIASVAALMGDRARATMLMCLMAGRSHTATELARAANVTKQTASSHLSKLVDARLLAVENLGRNRYFRLADHEVGTVLELLAGLAERTGAIHIDTGPRDPAMRKARVCYDHLAGELGVLVYDSLAQQRLLHVSDDGLALSESGQRFVENLGVDLAPLERRHRPMCLACLDWSERRHHLAGALGAAILNRLYALGWARPLKGTRIILFSAVGERSLRSRFRLAR